MKKPVEIVTGSRRLSQIMISNCAENLIDTSLTSHNVILNSIGNQQYTNWKSQIVTSNLTTKDNDELLKSQIAISKSTENQHDKVLISQIVTSKPIERRGGMQKPAKSSRSKSPQQTMR